MIAWLISLLAKTFGGVFSDYLSDLNRQREAEKVGSLTQAADSERQAKEKVNAASDARDRTADLTADQLRDIKPGADPDFRD